MKNLAGLGEEGLVAVAWSSEPDEWWESEEKKERKDEGRSSEYLAWKTRQACSGGCAVDGGAPCSALAGQERISVFAPAVDSISRISTCRNFFPSLRSLPLHHFPCTPSVPHSNRPVLSSPRHTTRSWS